MHDSPQPPRRVDDPATIEEIERLVSMVGGRTDDADGRMIVELVQTCLKLIPDGHDTGQVKLLNRALKEMRYAYRVFNEYRGTRKISVFGSARTPPDHPDYLAARAFSAAMARRQWMCITGAGDGIMKAGHEGPQREASFGLSIRLPFETTANTVIAGDPKLVNFRYFFTRKLMFLSQAEAVALFPGGFGTMDEAYEALTLVQTGKTQPVPIVMVEGDGGGYWKNWDRWVRENLLAKGLISPEDTGIYFLAPDARSARDHITRFYRNYHSSRYVKDDFVVRLRAPLKNEDVERLNDEFASLVKEGRIVQRGAYQSEEEHPELPRLAFTHTRNHFGLLRRFIDRINDCETV